MSIALQSRKVSGNLRFVMVSNKCIFKKKGADEAFKTGSTLSVRNQEDQSAPLGIATTRYEDRMATEVLGAGNAVVHFDTHEAVCGAGVLFLLPVLLSHGLLKTKEIYTIPQNHYYGLESIILTLAFIALLSPSRFNRTAAKFAKTLNQTETVFQEQIYNLNAKSPHFIGAEVRSSEFCFP